jgi:hypothetical protein
MKNSNSLFFAFEPNPLFFTLCLCPTKTRPGDDRKTIKDYARFVRENESKIYTRPKHIEISQPFLALLSQTTSSFINQIILCKKKKG